MPKEQHNDVTAYSLLSLAGIKEEDKWSNASNNSLRMVDIMGLMATNYRKRYAPNSREGVRKKAVQPLCNGAKWSIKGNECSAFNFARQRRTLFFNYPPKSF